MKSHLFAIVNPSANKFFLIFPRDFHEPILDHRYEPAPLAARRLFGAWRLRNPKAIDL